MKEKHILPSCTPLVLLVFVTASLSGCAWFKSRQVETAEQLAAEGMAYFDEEDYGEALEKFTTLKERYPYSRYAILAELKVADAHFHREEYPEAIAAYEDFARLHPKNEAIPYVLYQIGASYYEQLLSSDRDQTPTYQAILAFERLIKAHPNSTYAKKAEAKVQLCRKLLAAHEMYVGRFYYKSKHYEAALLRCEGVLASYQDALSEKERKEVEELIQSCKVKLSETIE
ncbi:MAG: outer membrane protein assembly factor BamD [Deltaproteobacteria bacterium]|nr:MAG: outer membrane protein assembly factor BamD [Deltaproteobacteria bacterium]